MRRSNRKVQTTNMSPVLYFVLIMAAFAQITAFPAPPDDDRFLGREFASPGGHQLPSWLISQLRRGEEFPILAIDSPVIPYRVPVGGKRNSELTSSIMGIPRTMIDNGRKK